MTTAPLIEVQDLRIDLADGGSHVAAVEGVSFRIDRGETFGLVGESGCGKSITALALIGLLRRPLSIAAGAIRFEGREIQGLSAAEQRALRGNRIAMIFQDPLSHLNPVYTVGWQLREVMRVHGATRVQAEERALDLMRRVGIPEPGPDASASTRPPATPVGGPGSTGRWTPHCCWRRWHLARATTSTSSPATGWCAPAYTAHRVPNCWHSW